MMGEYGGQLSGKGLAILLMENLTTLMNFLQTPEGWVFIAIAIITLFFAFSRR